MQLPDLVVDQLNWDRRTAGIPQALLEANLPS